jgi:signal transduction histidine kinase
MLPPKNLVGGFVRLDPSIAADVERVGRIAAVPTILQVIAHTTGMRLTAVSRVTEKTWTACAVLDRLGSGLKPGSELDLGSTICNEVRQHHQPVVFGDADSHPHFSNHPLPKKFGFRSYASIPIFRRDGTFFGTLCALDPEPRSLDEPNVQRTLELFAQLIGAQLEIEEQLVISDQALLDAREVAKLREQFIAVLGHDLRGPLQAISMGAELLSLGTAEPAALRNLERIRNSCSRMYELIHDILDFARGRLGDGIPVNLRTDEDVADALEQVVTEVRTAHPLRAIDVRMELVETVTCDCRRIAQLFGNLLNNAIEHGAEDRPIAIIARNDGGDFEISVTNDGEPIPPVKLSRLFQPFSRSVSDGPGSGLGLGLYIASEIARAHRGALQVTSTSEQGTRFVFRMPGR